MATTAQQPRLLELSPEEREELQARVVRTRQALNYALIAREQARASYKAAKEANDAAITAWGRGNYGDAWDGRAPLDPRDVPEEPEEEAPAASLTRSRDGDDEQRTAPPHAGARSAAPGGLMPLLWCHQPPHHHRCPGCGAPWRHGAPICQAASALRCPTCWETDVRRRERRGRTYRTDVAVSLATIQFRTPA